MAKKKSIKKKKAPARAVVPKKKAKVAPVKKKAAVVQRTPVPPKKLAPVTVASPERAPQRKILNGDRTVVVVPEKKVLFVPVVEAPPEPVLAKVIPIAPVSLVKKEVPLPDAVAWNNLPSYLPIQSRFYVSMAEKECRAAAPWPFPFARFIAGLPASLCGVGFALMLLTLDRSNSDVAELIKKDIDFVERMLKREREKFLESCNALCPEMYRKVKTQLGGVGVAVDTLLERYLASKVDRNFQLTVGALVLRAMAED